MVEIFALDEELARWEAELPLLHGLARLDLLANLAWHLRQRDPARACALARDACGLLPLLPDAGRRQAAARFMLVEGEVKWLFGELDAARALADQAGMEFELQGDPIGSADAHWLRSWIEADRGNSTACDRRFAPGGARLDQRFSRHRRLPSQRFRARRQLVDVYLRSGDGHRPGAARDQPRYQ